jgi:hypothetical protein
VAINKDSAEEDPHITLREAAEEKKPKYAILRDFLSP